MVCKKTMLRYKCKRTTQTYTDRMELSLVKRLLWVNACMRGKEISRTYRLCRTFLDEWLANNPDTEITERDLTDAPLPIMTSQLAKERDEAVKRGELDSTMVRPAREFASADIVVIGAPYWDLSFPAALKVYFEWVSAIGITFRYTNEGVLEGLCKAKKLIYITTAGGPVQGQNFGFDYVAALGRMFGINDCSFVAAENLDVFGVSVEDNLKRAEVQLKEIAKR